MSNGIKIDGILSRGDKQTAAMPSGTITGINSSYIEVAIPAGQSTTCANIDTSNSHEGDIISITKHSGTISITFQDNSILGGNIYLNGSSCLLDNNEDILTLILVGNNWKELSRSNKSTTLSNQLQHFVWGGNFNSFSLTTAYPIFGDYFADTILSARKKALINSPGTLSRLSIQTASGASGGIFRIYLNNTEVYNIDMAVANFVGNGVGESLFVDTSLNINVNTNDVIYVSIQNSGISHTIIQLVQIY